MWRTRLRLAIERVSRDLPSVDGGLARLIIDGAPVHFRIAVELLAEAAEELILVCFTEQPASSAEAGDGLAPAQDDRMAELERELAEALDAAE